MSDKFVTRWFRSSLDTYEVDTGIIRTKLESRYNNTTVNASEFAAQLAATYNELDQEGYDVVNVVPLLIGSSDTSISRQGNYLGDVGFTPTRGAVVVGKKRE